MLPLKGKAIYHPYTYTVVSIYLTHTFLLWSCVVSTFRNTSFFSNPPKTNEESLAMALPFENDITRPSTFSGICYLYNVDKTFINTKYFLL